jgi:hypothetical protein
LAALTTAVLAASLTGCAAAGGRSQIALQRNVAASAAGVVVPAPATPSFVSLWPVPPRNDLVLEQLSLSNGRPLRDLGAVPIFSTHVGMPAAAGNGLLWLTIDRGPRSHPEPALSELFDPIPGTCAASVDLVNPATLERRTLMRFSDSLAVEDVVPSPDGRAAAALVSDCTAGELDLHLLVFDLRSGRQWSIAGNAAPCHTLASVSWSPDGSKLLFVYGPPSDLHGRQPRAVIGGCPIPRPSDLAIVSANHASQLSTARLIGPPEGCSFTAATFDRLGIAAVEACSQGGPVNAFPYDYEGGAYLAQLSDAGRLLRRLTLKVGLNESAAVTDPRTGLVIVNEYQPWAVLAKVPGHDWIWAFNGYRLRTIARYPFAAGAQGEAPAPW